MDVFKRAERPANLALSGAVLPYAFSPVSLWVFSARVHSWDRFAGIIPLIALPGYGGLDLLGRFLSISSEHKPEHKNVLINAYTWLQHIRNVITTWHFYGPPRTS